MTAVDSSSVRNYLLGLQERITSALEQVEGPQGARFVRDAWAKGPQERLQGDGITKILEGGRIWERAGCGFSHVRGPQLPPSATQHRPELAGAPFEAMGVSLVMHPNNPYIPTTHANVRFFIAEKEGAAPIWWFGGGFDLTPYYGFEEDCNHWHQQCLNACQPFGEGVYPKFKTWCDDYFFLKHRNEARGIGGLFFDDLNEQSFEYSFGLMQSIGNHFIKAYAPIVEKRKDTPFGEREKAFQRYRRGRYVEFNLVYDRGTLFGLQTGGRTESILMSLPPEVTWEYNWHPEPGTEEARLYTDFLPARDWI